MGDGRSGASRVLPRMLPIEERVKTNPIGSRAPSLRIATYQHESAKVSALRLGCLLEGEKHRLADAKARRWRRKAVSDQ